MPRQPRIEFENAVYHVLARGNQRQDIFTDRHDHETFIRTLGETCERTGFQVLAWVLMGNHYHAVIRTPNANLVEGMQWLQNTYTRRFNVRHQQWGRLFGDRYKSILVEGTTPGAAAGGGDYLTSLIEYVLLNPARSGLIQAANGESIQDYEWSSLRHSVMQPARIRSKWDDVPDLLALFGLKDTAADRRKFVQRLDTRMRSEEALRCGLPNIDGPALHNTLSRGWFWGSQAFREAMLKRIDQSAERPINRNYTSSKLGKDHSSLGAEAILAKGLQHFRFAPTMATTSNKRGDLRRVAIAWAIWKRTTVPQAWIAEHLGMKTPANVSQQVRCYDQIPTADLSATEKQWRSFF